MGAAAGGEGGVTMDGPDDQVLGLVQALMVARERTVAAMREVVGRAPGNDVLWDAVEDVVQETNHAVFLAVRLEAAWVNEMKKDA